MAEYPDYHSIGAVERDTGIGRDTLRIWERRYGFPKPQRNEKGERIYPERQLRRLQRIRRLLDQGLRPGKLLPLSEKDLDDVETSLLPEISTPQCESVDQIHEAIRSADASQLELMFQRQYDKQGMQEFILKTVIPLLKTVGEQWAGGSLQIYQEHFFSEQLIRFLNREIANMQKSTDKPRVLLATLPGEEHTLGLLMVVAMLAANGLQSVNLGSDVPMDQIAQAVHQFHADIVGITFSGAYHYKSIRPHLLELRALIPGDVAIWTGGEGVRRLRKLPPGITKFNSLENLPL